ncbi:MAG: cytochrome ubiquinol oxidase subunit I [Myxococcales bacterium]|nr:cytochrome ubiquinol oxidase subunit I [Myxococcales bacterium]
MDLDPVALSRAQFALTVMFHYLFPPLSIGLGAIMVILEGAYLRTRDHRYEAAVRFFTKLFAVNFAVGVASGIVMEFQFGTNWATYSRFVGDVFGSALAAEGIFAFFLESGFLAILVFGWDRVGPKMHFFSTLMVFLGSCFSAVWIVIANSWQHTPAGFHLVGEGADLRAEITDFWEMVFNPSSMHRLNHVLLGSFLQGSFFVTSVSAWYLLKKRHVEIAKRSFTVALALGAFSSVAILVSGHAQAVAVSENQPAKLAAFEAHYETGPGDLVLFGWPNDDAGRVDYALAIPGMLSFLVHGDADAPVRGLHDFPEDERPPVAVPFVTYHLMVALGTFFIALTLFGLLQRIRGKLWDQRWLLWIFVVSVVGPYVANQAGWVATEVGRQPWVVYGLLKTADAASPSVKGAEVLTSIILFGLIYTALFALWVFVLNEKIKHGPDDPDELATRHKTKAGFVDAAADAESHSLTESEHPQGA